MLIRVSEGSYVEVQLVQVGWYLRWVGSFDLLDTRRHCIHALILNSFHNSAPVRIGVAAVDITDSLKVF